MQPITIPESGMNFGPFAPDKCFHVEKSKVYMAIQNRVKMAEFLWLRTNENNKLEIWIVEAKSSSPHPVNSPEDFDKFIDEIKQKLINALSLGFASVLRRHQQAQQELPCAFKTINLSRVQVKFVLVLKDHPDKALLPITRRLYKALRPTIRTWAFEPTSVMTLNKAGALEWGLIEDTS